MYTKRIRWWLENSNLPIYVVDSNNKGFPELLDKYNSTNRLFIYYFDQNKYIIDKNHKKNHQTKYELLSLKMAYEYYKEQWNEYSMIIKITGKYILPELENKLIKIPNNIDILLQYRHSKYWQNTELLGIANKTFLPLLNSLDDTLLFEKIINLRLPYYKTHRFKKLNIPKEYRTKTQKGFSYNYL